MNTHIVTTKSDIGGAQIFVLNLTRSLKRSGCDVEVAVGEGGVLHNPDDHEGFVEDILKLENDQNFYNVMKLKALEQSGKFNITDTTKKLVCIFNKLL